jgi:hypothetical protein
VAHYTAEAPKNGLDLCPFKGRLFTKYTKKIYNVDHYGN